MLNQEISNRMAAIINFHIKLVQADDDFLWSRVKPNLDQVVESMAAIT